MQPLIWSSRLARSVTLLVSAWLVSIELGSSRTASKNAAAHSNTGETVVDTATGRLFDTTALIHLLTGLLASLLLPSRSIRARRTVFGLGLALLIGAGALSNWARRHLGRFHRDDLTVHDDHSLVDSGPYGSIRHPLYLATASALVGAGAVLGNWVSVATAGLPTAALVRRIAVEESMLERHLGTSYVAYQARTKRLVPGIW
ncbi:MAG: isoprenylcysteine carboxylmethyltransferase family protein [Acidimicrobiales bacterium]